MLSVGGDHVDGPVTEQHTSSDSFSTSLKLSDEGINVVNGFPEVGATFEPLMLLQKLFHVWLY